MTKSVKYRVIFSDVARISGEVNRAMEEGWQPQGGAFTYMHPDGSRFVCQAMVSAKKRNAVEIAQMIAVAGKKKKKS